MSRKYVYPNVFISQEDVKELSNLQADIEKTVRARKSEWIRDGGVDEQWDEYVKSLEAYGLQDYLALFQKYLDAYFAD